MRTPPARKGGGVLCVPRAGGALALRLRGWSTWIGGIIGVKVLVDYENFQGVFDATKVNWEEGYITINKK